MTDTISLTGLVATTPKHVVTATGLSITSFRFASTQRRYDRAAQKWVDGDAKCQIERLLSGYAYRRTVRPNQSG